MDLGRAEESLSAARLCIEHDLANSAASRAYYAIFQAAHFALERAGFARAAWSHPALQAVFATELVHRRKVYPAIFRDYLSSGLRVRQAADYGHAGVSRKIAERLVRRAESFVSSVRQGAQRAPGS